MQLHRHFGPVGPPSGIQCWTLGTKQVWAKWATGRNVAYSNDEIVCIQRLLRLFVREYPRITHLHNLWPRDWLFEINSDYHKNIEYHHIPYIDSMLVGHEIVTRASVSIQGLLFQFIYRCPQCVAKITFTIRVN